MATAKGLFSALAGRFLFRHAKVTAVETLSPRFRRLEAQGTEFANVDFTPGDKVQIFLLGEDMRTYTPVTWDRASGTASFIGFIHGDTLGSRWLREVKVGDQIELFGPRGSVAVNDGQGPVLVFGDETSVAVALSLTRANPAREVITVLETDAVDEVKTVTTAVGLTATIIARGATQEAATAMEPALARGAFPVLTGNAASIQALKQHFAKSGQSLKGKTKAYWAKGKSGLD